MGDCIHTYTSQLTLLWWCWCTIRSTDLSTPHITILTHNMACFFKYAKAIHFNGMVNNFLVWVHGCLYEIIGNPCMKVTQWCLESDLSQVANYSSVSSIKTYISSIIINLRNSTYVYTLLAKLKYLKNKMLSSSFLSNWECLLDCDYNRFIIAKIKMITKIKHIMAK